jgi:pyruvate kinase
MSRGIKLVARVPHASADAVWCDAPSLSDAVRAVRDVRSFADAPLTALAAVIGRGVKVGEVPGGALKVAAGDRVVLSTRPGVSDGGAIPVRGRELARDVSRGDAVYADGSAVVLEVDDVRGAEVRCRARTGGLLHEARALWLPSTPRSTPCFSSDDRDALAALAAAGADWIALPDVREAADLAPLRTALRERGHDLPVIACLGAGVDLDAVKSIAAACEAVLIDRGALAAGVPIGEVMDRQAEWIGAAREAGAVTIVAGGLLERLGTTLPELADVERLMLLDPDALLLESPALPVARMFLTSPSRAPHFLGTWIPASMARCAEESGAKAILIATTDGRSALQAARARATVPLIALTPRPEIARRLGLAYGLRAVEQPPVPADARVAAAGRTAIEMGLAAAGDTVALLTSDDAFQAMSLTVFRARR